MQDLPSYSRAVQSCGRAKRWDYALQLLSSIQNQGIDSMFCTTVIGACRHAAAWEPALAMLHQLETGALGIQPTVHHYGAVASCLEFVGNWEKALALTRSLQSHGLMPSVQFCGAIITACEKSCQWERALSLLRLMGELSAGPDVMAFNTSIAACGKGRRWKDAVLLLAEMSASELLPSVVTNSIAWCSAWSEFCFWFCKATAPNCEAFARTVRLRS